MDPKLPNYPSFPLFPLGNYKFLLWVWFCFANKFIFIILFVLVSAYKWYHIFVFLWDMTIFRGVTVLYHTGQGQNAFPRVISTSCIQRGLSKMSQFSCVHAQSLQSYGLFATLWTIARQAPLSMKFFRQEYWSRLPCPPPRIFPTQGSKPNLLRLLHWQEGSLPPAPPKVA